MSTQRAERGFTLVELMVVIAIAAIVATILVGMSVAQGPGSAAATRYAFLSMMNLATSEATGNPTDNGATLVITPNATNTTLALYDGRPNGGTFTLTPPRHTITAPLAVTVTGQNAVVIAQPIAIFIDSFGSATYQNWTPSGTAIGALPSCNNAGAPLVFTYAGGSITMSSCYAKVTAANASGTTIADPTP